MPRPSTTTRSAYASAVDLLARKDYSEREIRARLRRRGYEPAAIEDAIERLGRVRAVDDARLADAFARSRAQQGIGRRRIRQALHQKGISRPLIDGAIRANVLKSDETATVDRLSTEYWTRHAAVEPRRRLQRLFAFLVRRGFEPALVSGRLFSRFPALGDALAEVEESTIAEGGTC